MLQEKPRKRRIPFPRIPIGTILVGVIIALLFWWFMNWDWQYQEYPDMNYDFETN